MSRGAEIFVIASVPFTVALGRSGDGVISLALGLLGVLLARTVFVDRENRKLGRHQRLSETLPLTMTAMLISGVVIWDNQMGFSTAAFTGIGVGWTAILLIDVIGRRILDPGERGKTPPDPDPPGG